MTTDSERREVARRLRNIESHVVPGSKFADNPMTVDFIAAAAFYDLPYVQGLFARLADLIEPSCDRDALLKVADMLECDGECSECECGKGTFCEAPTIAAARIREALGVEL